jgi:hypothetical protein
MRLWPKAGIFVTLGAVIELFDEHWVLGFLAFSESGESFQLI